MPVAGPVCSSAKRAITGGAPIGTAAIDANDITGDIKWNELRRSGRFRRFFGDGRRGFRARWLALGD